MASMLRARFHPAIADFGAGPWNALVAGDNPFACHGFLAALEQTGCIRREYGWQAHHLGLYRADRLVAAAPCYIKTNSWGEFVFDFAWADAWERAGGAYYPKLLLGIPFSPVTGPRLLVGTGADAPELRRALVMALCEETERRGWSSAHANFLPEDQANAFDANWLARLDLQYHWHNAAYAGFDDFLGALRHKKRKNIRTERRAVATSGLRLETVPADSLAADELDAVHQLYLRTFADKGNFATLGFAFFRQLASLFGPDMQLALARHKGEIVAMALFLIGGNTLYGRYWGSRLDVPGLHFELCYYQGIELAIRRKLLCFEPGAQGLHKLARGFLPVRTHSRHYIADSGFRAAVAESLQHERLALTQREAELLRHSPYVRDSRIET